MKKGFILVLFVLLAMITLPVYASAYQIISLENFQKERTYTYSTFTDVTSANWYCDNVASVYEYGLIEGVGNSRFDANGNITIAQSIAVAVRVNSIYMYGDMPGLESDDGDLWYSPYVNYALLCGIIETGDYNYDAPATRAEFTTILAASIDPIDLEEINWVDDGAIPDVPLNADYANAVYMLYRAGILAGSGDAGNFNPNSTITRAEAAAIITRIVDPDLRQAIELNGSY